MDTPGGEQTRWSRALGPLSVAACVGLIVAHAARGWSQPPYGPDSWGYYDLARTVLEGDLFRTTCVRQYQLETPFSMSFPPALPFAIALTEAALGVGWRAGFVLNHLVLAALLATLAWLSWRAVQDLLPGAVAFALLLTIPSFSAEEVAASGSVPLAVLWLAVLLHVLLGADRAWPSRAALAGVVAGLWALTRFDFLLGAVSLGLVLIARQPTPWQGLRVAGAYGTTLTLTLSPWIAYSLARFGRPWISDNARTALFVDTPYVTEYLPFPEVAPTLLTAPTDWLARKLPLMAGVLASVGPSAARTALPALALVLLLALFVARRPGRARLLAEEPVLRAWACLLPSLVLLHLSIALTGYAVERYNAPLFLWLLLGAVLTLVADPRLRHASSTRVALAACLIVVVLGFARGPRATPSLGPAAVIVGALAGLAASRSRFVPIAGGTLLASAAVLFASARVDRLELPDHPRPLPWPEEAVRALGASGARVIAKNSIQASRLAAEHDLQTYLFPNPSRPLTAFLFLERYGITHVTAGNPVFDAIVDEAFVHDELRLGQDTVRVLRGRRPGVTLVPLSREPGTVGPLSVRVAAVPPELSPGCRLVFNGSGMRVVRAVDGHTVRLDFPLFSQAAASPLVQDGPPFPALLLPPVVPR